jgi:hypothetical protein
MRAAAGVACRRQFRRFSASADLPPCGTACATPASCSREPEKTLHSSDIAFKPASSGWGYTKKYAANWDKIFKKNMAAAPIESTAKKGEESGVVRNADSSSQ